MMRYRILVVAAGLFVLLLASSFAQSQTPSSTASSPQVAPLKRYVLKDSAPRSGSRVRDDVGYSYGFPIDRSYASLTSEEKAKVRDQYEGMSESDEPPFPAGGFASIIREVARSISVMQVEGDVNINVTIDKFGKAKSFDLVQYPSIEAAKAVALILGRSKYKPAVCGGEPCEMQLPFRATLVLQ